MSASPDPAPRWTSEPPSEPGIYWMRQAGSRPTVACIQTSMCDGPPWADFLGTECFRWLDDLTVEGAEWWPVPIPEPGDRFWEAMSQAKQGGVYRHPGGAEIYWAYVPPPTSALHAAARSADAAALQDFRAKMGLDPEPPETP